MAKALAGKTDRPWREIQTSGWPDGPMRFTRAEMRAAAKEAIAARLAREAEEKETKRRARKTARALEAARKSRNGRK
jgi:hypothetical protein